MRTVWRLILGNGRLVLEMPIKVIFPFAKKYYHKNEEKLFVIYNMKIDLENMWAYNFPVRFRKSQMTCFSDFCLFMNG